ncbi:MAG: hypothetical protein O3C10_03830 [Chloroflexi bacterium]|nr:hypothetical protein [Chloroflexota bacterium]
MTVLLYMGRAMMPEKMPMNILHMEGTMVTRNTGQAYMAGLMMHAMMGVVFAIIHTLLFQAFDLDSNLVVWGIVFGAAHWVIAGMGMGMIATMHPMMRSGEMAAPGAFVRNLPGMTVMGFFMVHIVYGLVVGLVYEAAW